MRIDAVGADELRKDRAAFAALLKDVVDDGAGVGFLRPVALSTAEAYWDGVADDVDEGHRTLLAAREGPELAGAVQMALATRDTGLHRAEVQKLMVSTKARGRGVAKALMGELERLARERGRSLLVLDTFEGSLAEGLYRRWGWTEAGRFPRWALDHEWKLRATVLFYKDL